MREREIEAKVHEFMLERGCEIIYDIIVASGGNTSPYRRWATDKLIRQGDLVIVDINAVGPSGYFIDFVRRFKCAKKMNQKEIDLYFAIETFAGHPDLQQTARLEENVLVSGTGPVVFTMMEHMEEAMKQ